MSEHAPLPPDPVPTLETIDAKLQHAIVVVEHTRRCVDRWDERVEGLVERERALSTIAHRLSNAATRVIVARAVSAAAPPARWAMLACLAVFGGVLGSFVWQLASVSALAFAR